MELMRVENLDLTSARNSGKGKAALKETHSESMLVCLMVPKRDYNWAKMKDAQKEPNLVDQLD